MNQTTTPAATAETITERVRERYAAAAQRVQSGDGCCVSSCCSDPVTSNLYDHAQTEGLPEDAVLASIRFS